MQTHFNFLYKTKKKKYNELIKKNLIFNEFISLAASVIAAGLAVGLASIDLGLVKVLLRTKL